jgi:hypothetical protein
MVFLSIMNTTDEQRLPFERGATKAFDGHRSD